MSHSRAARFGWGARAMLFDHHPIALAGAEPDQLQLDYYPRFLDSARADRLLALSAELPWRQDQLRMFGRRIDVPRLHCWLRSDGVASGAIDYRWSGVEMVAATAPDWLCELTAEIAAVTGERFNRCLANYYRDGRDSVDWHSDDEPELGVAPVIASLSLGSQRRFQLRQRASRELHNFELEHGSLLVMGAGVQRYWQHRLPKSSQPVAPRVNFTLRHIAAGAP